MPAPQGIAFLLVASRESLPLDFLIARLLTRLRLARVTLLARSEFPL